jgi:2-polyprenyl-3-methyl-5-hydroxy-6-metoxy-1,4-benzoquinol methylase
MVESIEKRFAGVEKSTTFQNILDSLNLRNKSVLDIGCSYGEFLIHFGKGSTGVTLTQAEVDYGLEKGLDMRFGNIESDSFVLESTYDVIFANNIFEHLYSPHHFLIKIKKYLKPNGILILGVPAIPKIVSLVRLPKFRGSLAVEHINFFTRDTLIKTVERGGWNIQSARGFHFSNRIVDMLCNPIYPHVYVTATSDPSFKYPERRMKELLGYEDILGPIE